MGEYELFTLVVAIAIVMIIGRAVAAVGAVTTLILPRIGWAAAFAFAAAVAPTDAVAATSVLNRLGAPRRIVTIMEGESLINDGVALTAFGERPPPWSRSSSRSGWRGN